MRYALIAAALGWTEVPDNEEGLFLQPEEAAAINAALGRNAANEKAVEDLKVATERIAKLEGDVQAAGERDTEANSRISALEAENKRLGAQSSGAGTTLPTGGDEITKEQGAKKITLNSPEHPLNVAAASRVAAAKRK